MPVIVAVYLIEVAIGPSSWWLPDLRAAYIASKFLKRRMNIWLNALKL